jgi:predicted nucleic acid-binding protein
MIAVVDASAAAKLFLEEAGSDLVRSLWFRTELSAPTILLAELASAVHRGGQSRPPTPADAVEFVRSSARWRDVDVDLATYAASIAGDLGARGMDAIYLATALDLADHDVDVALLSFDTRQREAALDLGIPVIPAEVPPVD